MAELRQQREREAFEKSFKARPAAVACSTLDCLCLRPLTWQACSSELF